MLPESLSWPVLTMAFLACVFCGLYLLWHRGEGLFAALFLLGALCLGPYQYLRYRRQQHVHPISYLHTWIAQRAAVGQPLVVFLCGAPGCGKSHATQALLSQANRPPGMPDVEVHVVSNDAQAGLYYVRGRKVMFRPIDNPEGRYDFDLFRRTALEPAMQQFRDLVAQHTTAVATRPQVIVLDDTNTCLRDFAAKVHVALEAGVPVANIAWFVADHGLPEDAEVEFLVKRQQQRHGRFWAAMDAGAPQPPSDGKVVSEDTIRRMVRRLRETFFEGRRLVFWPHRYVTGVIAAPKQYIYTALFLTPESRQELLAVAEKRWKQLLDNVKADHCTIRYEPRLQLTRDEERLLGQTFPLSVTSTSPADPRLQAVTVTIGGPLRSANDVPHITVSHAAEVAPVFANHLLARGPTEALPAPLPLTARFGAFVEWHDGSRGVVYRVP